MLNVWGGEIMVCRQFSNSRLFLYPNIGLVILWFPISSKEGYSGIDHSQLAHFLGALRLLCEDPR